MRTVLSVGPLKLILKRVLKFHSFIPTQFSWPGQSFTKRSFTERTISPTNYSKLVKEELPPQYNSDVQLTTKTDGVIALQQLRNASAGSVVQDKSDAISTEANRSDQITWLYEIRRQLRVLL